MLATSDTAIIPRGDWRRPGPGSYLLFFALAAGCASPPLIDAESKSQEWGVRVSELSAPLSIPCAGVEATASDYDVHLDDYSGWVVLVEREENRVWFRDPFGVVPDMCWWVHGSGPPPAPLSNSNCVRNGLQDGTCTSSEDVSTGWVFSTPGQIQLFTDIGESTVNNGVLMAWAGDRLHRLDLTVSAHEPIDTLEHRNSFGKWLSPLTPPNQNLPEGPIEVSDSHLLGWDATKGDLWIFDRQAARRQLSNYDKKGTPSGNGLLAAAGDTAALALSQRVSIYASLSGTIDTQSIRHGDLPEEPRDIAIDPQALQAYVLGDDVVVAVSSDAPGIRFQTPGATDLFLGWPAGKPTVYAWGNVNGTGVVYRLDAASAEATAWELEWPLLGLGTGEVFQELVAVLDTTDNGIVVQGYLDSNHVDALAPGNLGLALVPVIESPRDNHLNDKPSAEALLSLVPQCADYPEEKDLVCCIQQARGDLVERQLNWLSRRLDPDVPNGPIAIQLGINPSALGQSTTCGLAGQPDERSHALPNSIGNWLEEHQDSGAISLSLFVHSSPNSAKSSWVLCPETWADAPSSCWDLEINEENLSHFYGALAQAAALEPWGFEEPDWSLLGGGYSGVPANTDTDWTQLFQSFEMPDNGAPDALFFGAADMNPLVSFTSSKEISPLDSRNWPTGLPIGKNAVQWDRAPSQQDSLIYRPGQTFATTWLYELRRSGLLFIQYGAFVDPQTQWDNEAFRGRETEAIMTHADFAVIEHLLVSRWLSHKDTEATKWTYIHLNDISRIQSLELETGWIGCVTDCATDTELDQFMQRIGLWSPIIQWKSTP